VGVGGKAYRLLIVCTLTVAAVVLAPAQSSAAAPQLGPVKHIHANGIDIGYRTGGHGPWLVMVIGRGATMAEWDPQLIAPLIADHRVLVFDNRGVATTNNPSRKTLSIQQMAHDTLALASALKIDTFDLMGWSMGTYISQQVTLDAPSRVRKLVLCAADPGGSHYVPPIPAVEKILTNPNGVTTAQLLALSFPPTRAGPRIRQLHDQLADAEAAGEGDRGLEGAERRLVQRAADDHAADARDVGESRSARAPGKRSDHRAARPARNRQGVQGRRPRIPVPGRGRGREGGRQVPRRADPDGRTGRGGPLAVTRTARLALAPE
jgi:pimeloyl-ACP methyl ester carboxylesterase